MAESVPQRMESVVGGLRPRDVDVGKPLQMEGTSRWKKGQCTVGQHGREILALVTASSQGEISELIEGEARSSCLKSKAPVSVVYKQHGAQGCCHILTPMIYLELVAQQ